MNLLATFPAIDRWLDPWPEQLAGLGEPDDYRVILTEVAKSETYKEHKDSLTLLNDHLDLACMLCGNFDGLLGEKRNLPDNLDDANRVILDKLAEIRAIVGLDRLGFSRMEFLGSPDFVAQRAGSALAVEVTRLGSSVGKRSKVWDQQVGSVESGFFMGMMHSGGRVETAISEAIYREIEDKYGQLKRAKVSVAGRIVWISLGSAYLVAGHYELPGVGLLRGMTRIATRALVRALRDIAATGAYRQLSHVVLSLGRDREDVILPRSPI